MSHLIAPSILAANFANLREEISRVEAAGADWIHVDVMDGHFVPNLTIGPPVVASLRKVTKLVLDVHLMIEKPERYLPAFLEAGSDVITLHVESTTQMAENLKLIRSQGCRAGITLRPGTDLTSLLPYLANVDLVLVMTVEPGFGGQSFMVEQVSKIQRLAELRTQNNWSYLIEVDGGVSDKTLQHLSQADVLVAGSYIFGKKDYQQPIAHLKGLKP